MLEVSFYMVPAVENHNATGDVRYAFVCVGECSVGEGSVCILS